MPAPRIRGTEGKVSIYHCMSRVVNGEKIFEDVAKEMLRKHLWQAAEFSGLQILTYTILSNHFHVLVAEPDRKQITLSDAELIRRYRVRYPKPTKYRPARICVLEEILAAGGPDAERLRKGLRARMHDVSQFMKTVKQRFSVWFNRTHNRFGTLWADRFRSTLVEADSGDTLWGLDQAGSWVSAWTTGSTLKRLAVTGDERAGVVGRVRPVGLLRFPAFAPILQGFEPYTDLVAGIGRVVADRDAVCEFAYDWRLSVEHNAGELAKTVDWHLRRWRAHPKGSAEAKVVLVAHSMGGLIAHYYTNVLGGAGDVSTTVTLGTPYHGAVKAAHILACGRGGPVPLPHRRLPR